MSLLLFAVLPIVQSLIDRNLPFFLRDIFYLFKYLHIYLNKSLNMSAYFTQFFGKLSLLLDCMTWRLRLPTFIPSQVFYLVKISNIWKRVLKYSRNSKLSWLWSLRRELKLISRMSTTPEQRKVGQCSEMGENPDENFQGSSSSDIQMYGPPQKRQNPNLSSISINLPSEFLEHPIVQRTSPQIWAILVYTIQHPIIQVKVSLLRVARIR